LELPTVYGVIGLVDVHISLDDPLVSEVWSVNPQRVRADLNTRARFALGGEMN